MFAPQLSVKKHAKELIILRISTIAKTFNVKSARNHNKKNPSKNNKVVQKTPTFCTPAFYTIAKNLYKGFV